MKLPKHLSLSIEHNPHEVCYESVKEYFDNHLLAGYQYDISEEEAKKAIEKNELWAITWYPRTSISHNFVMASTLEKCLELALEIEEKE